MASRLISFTTDYGIDDGFVAACHGVITRIADHARVLDITHTVPAQSVQHGAAVLAQTVPYLPEGSVHLAVVDPGVGTTRKPLVIIASDGLLIGPDNGLLPQAAHVLGGIMAAYELRNPEFQLPEVSATFHGRDIFAPAAAHLANGIEPERFGNPVEPTNLVRLPAFRVTRNEGALTASVRTVDHFGNVQLAASDVDLAESGIGANGYVLFGTEALPVTFGRTFADAADNTGLLLTDSAGYLAVAINGGSAAEALGIGRDVAGQECTIATSHTVTGSRQARNRPRRENG